MPSFIESLESRTLLSAAPPAVSALFTQGKIVDQDGKALAMADVAGLKVIGADLKAAKLLKTDAVAIRKLLKGDAATGKLLATRIATTDKVIAADVKKLEAEGNALAKKPTNAKLLAAVAAEKIVLATHASNALSTFSNDAGTFQSTIDTDSSALASPSQLTLDAAINSYQSNDGGALTTLEGAVTLALTNAPGSLLANVLALY